MLVADVAEAHVLLVEPEGHLGQRKHIAKLHVGDDQAPGLLPQFRDAGQEVEAARFAPNRLQHLLLASFAGKDARSHTRAGVPERRVPVHVMYPRLQRLDGILAVLVGVGPVVLQPAVYWDIHAAQRVHDAGETVEVGAHVVIYRDAQVVE